MAAEATDQEPTGPPRTDSVTRRAGWPRWATIALGSISGTAMSGMVFWALLGWQRQSAETQFRLDADRRVEMIQNEIQERLGTVRMLRAFYAGSHAVKRHDFRAFAQALVSEHAGTEALGWVRHVPAAERDTHQQAVRADGCDQYRITERSPQGRFIPADSREEYFPVCLIEPYEDHKATLGFDLGSHPACLAALNRARKTGGLAAARAAPLGQNGTERDALFVVAPASRAGPSADAPGPAEENLDGFVLGVFDVGEVVEYAVGVFGPAEVDIHVFDTSLPGQAPLIYAHASRACRQPLVPLTALPVEDSGTTHAERTLRVADQQWTVCCTPAELGLPTRAIWWPVAGLVAGLLLTGVGSGYLALMTGRTADVEKLVDKRTAQLRESEQRFRRLVENAGDAFCLLDDQGKILDVNQQMCDSLGYTREELLSLNVSDIDTSVITEKHVELHWKRATPVSPVTFEGTHRRKDGTTFPVEIRLARLESGGQRLMVGLARDITERKRAETALRESETKHRTLLENLPQRIFYKNRHSVYLSCNNNLAEDLGIKPEEVAGKTDFDLFSEELAEKYRADDRKIIESGKTEEIEERYIHDGEEFIVQTLKTPVRDERGNVVGILGVFWDVTQRKRAEESVRQEQRLLRKLLTLQEQERKLVAYEIHDGLAQQLTGALLRLQAFGRPQDHNLEEMQTTCDEVKRLLGESIAEVRRLISGLRPPILDESGVVAAIDYLVCEQQERGGPAVDFVHDVRFDRLAPPLESAVFRIVQESLTNARRHSQSQKVRVELSQTGDRLRVEVEDWGIGFDPETIEPHRFGLQGIRERARLLGGLATVDSAPGQGTRITVELPLVEKTPDETAPLPPWRPGR